MFAVEGEPTLRKMVIEQIRKVFRTALPIHTLRDNDGRVGQTFDPVSIDHNCSMVYVTAGSYLQLFVSSKDVMTAFTGVITCKNALMRPRVFGTFLLSHSLRMMNSFCSSRSLSNPVPFKSDSRVSHAT